jgi:uncharacterized protein (TIGR03000 family)
MRKLVALTLIGGVFTLLAPQGAEAQPGRGRGGHHGGHHGGHRGGHHGGHHGGHRGFHHGGHHHRGHFGHHHHGHGARFSVHFGGHGHRHFGHGGYGYWPGYRFYPYGSSYYPYSSYAYYPSTSYYAYPAYSSYYVAPSYASSYPSTYTYPDNAGYSTAPSTGLVTAGANTGVIEVRLPDANGEVWFDGQKMQQTGAVRSFTTPPLDPGSHTYQVTAAWSQDGRVVTQERTVRVQAGESVRVDFTQAAPVPTPRPSVIP